MAGLIPVEAVILIEQQLNQCTGKAEPLCNRFDLIGGTSTGDNDKLRTQIVGSDRLFTNNRRIDFSRATMTAALVAGGSFEHRGADVVSAVDDVNS